jgi:hypothetical protein
MKFNLLPLLALFVLTCDNIGPDKHFSLAADKKYLFKEGDLLEYESDNDSEHFKLIKIVNGKYSDSQSGTCGKPRLFVYEFQVAYIKPADTLDRAFHFVSESPDDCSHFLRPNTELITAMNSSYDADNYDWICWMTEFSDKMSNYQKHHKTLQVRNQNFKDVYEYNVTTGERLSTLYYTRSYGFVGYVLKNGTVFSLKR